MARIDGTHQLTELVRLRLGALKKASDSSNRATSERVDSRAPRSGQSSADGSVDIASTLAKRILLIAPDDPQRHRKAFRAFLEALLLAELGESLINDAAFYQMVDDIQQQMEADPQLAEALNDAGALLLQRPA